MKKLRFPTRIAYCYRNKVENALWWNSIVTLSDIPFPLKYTHSRVDQICEILSGASIQILNKDANIRCGPIDYFFRDTKLKFAPMY